MHFQQHAFDISNQSAKGQKDFLFYFPDGAFKCIADSYDLEFIPDAIDQTPLQSAVTGRKAVAYADDAKARAEENLYPAVGKEKMENGKAKC